LGLGNHNHRFPWRSFWIIIAVDEAKVKAEYNKSKWSKMGTNPSPTPPTGPCMSYGQPNPELVCPHCDKKGFVLTMPIKKKAGISGGKATAAVLTGGVSVIATGLSRKDAQTQAHCKNCSSTWYF